MLHSYSLFKSIRITAWVVAGEVAGRRQLPIEKRQQDLNRKLNVSAHRTTAKGMHVGPRNISPNTVKNSFILLWTLALL